ncbi:MAG TPA: porin [Gemmatimonadales bacterium]|nr:porin [Gemmatimonadales bacterium]
MAHDPTLRLRTALALCFSAPLAAQTPGVSPPKVTGYVQTRFEAIGDSALFKLRRVRVGVQGGLRPWASYKAQVELRSGGTGATPATVSATDLYLALTRGRWIATLGQSKTPFSLEFIRSSSALELPERSMAVDSLAPNRDVGVKVEWGAIQPVALQAGLFNGDGINRASNRDGRFLYLARAVVKPLTGLQLGLSAAAKPDTATWDAEVGLERPRLAARAEYLSRHRATADVTTRGWYALGAYEVVARRLQLVGRVQQFDPSSVAGGDRVTGYTGAVQYFWAGDDLKLQAEFTAFAEQGPAVANNRVIVQMQARF